MNAIASTGENSGTNVYTFPLPATGTGSSDVLTEEVMSRLVKGFRHDVRALKLAWETVIAGAYLSGRFEKPRDESDPFDAIFICDLRPDPVSRQDVERISRFSGIEDLSHKVQFDDEWDD